MIPSSVRNLFDFIDFLYLNKDYLLSKHPLIDALLELEKKRNSLSPKNNYKDRIEYTKIQGELEQKFEIVTNDTTNLIKEKIKDLIIADISTPIIYINAKEDLFELQKNFKENDLSLIFAAKEKYVEFRAQTKFHYFLQFFFNDLDSVLKEFFHFFNDSKENKFEAFETKAIHANSMYEVEEQLQKGFTKFTLPFSSLTTTQAKPINIQHPTPQALSLKEIALIYFYEGKDITRQNGNEIVKKYGFSSGEKLYNNYTFYSERSNRIGNEESTRKNKAKIKLLEKVISHLEAPYKQRAIDELKILSANVITI